MPLDEYARRRRFGVTPEPPPRVDEAGHSRFCVQRHNARRLHYDVRLEADGVLVSWAVPRGPSLDPADKRMAVHTEDHPVDYLTFEGVIPSGEYGAGSVMLWDLGTYELLGERTFAEQHARGDIKFRLAGRRLRGDFVLARTNREGGRDWLMIKKRDAEVVRGWNIEEYARSVASDLSQEEIARGEAGRRWTRQDGLRVDAPPVRPASTAPPHAELPPGAVRSPLPTLVTPMQPTAAAPFTDDRWAFELVHEGLRALAYGDGDRLRLLSERGDPLAAQFPELESLPRHVAATTWILDGVIALLDERGVADPRLLQPRLEARSPLAAARLARSRPVTYYVFDLLYLDEHDLRPVPLEARRELLRRVLRNEGAVAFSDSVNGRGETLFEMARARGAAGVIGKLRSAPYEEGRSPSWRVSRPAHRTSEAPPAGEERVPPAASGGRVGPPLLDDAREEVVVPVEGRPLRLTRLDKVLFPRDGYTKRDLINFYARIADFVLPYLRDRPLTLKRYPDGIEAPHFFQKRAVTSYPDWLSTSVLVTSEGEEMETIVCNDRATLIFLANLACIDQNPWMSRLDSLDTPDFLLLDLDPQHCAYDRVVDAALVLKALLDRIGLQGFPKTSGGRGLHVYVPLAPRYGFEQTRNLAHILARLACAERPDLFTLPRIVEKRERGKVYMDHPQNRKGSTISAPYGVRPVPAAQVATPLDWSEVRPGLSPQQFTMSTIFSRLERVGDLFSPVLTLQQGLEGPIQRLETLL